MKKETYLKIANIYFLLKDYNNAIETLEQIPNIKSSFNYEKNSPPLTVSKNNFQNNI